jgi:Kef-type K+ transport system membrane component KefB
MLAVTVPPLVAEMAVVLFAAAAISYVCTRIGLVPIVGFVLAGAAIGPYALGVVDDVELVEQTAEIGVIFLLFGIGLELSADRLRSLGSLLFGGGAIQVALTIALVAGGCVAFGVDTKTAIYTGCLVSLSSTAIVLKLLSDRRQTTSPPGEVAVSFLIFQDIAVVIMVLLVPMLGPDATGGVGEILGALVRSLVVIAFVLVATRWFVPRALDKVAENSTEEVFLLSVAAFALTVAYAASLLGLTDSLGAFIAGLVISSSRHRARALRYITPFQMLFSAIFFASIGMLLDIGFVVDRWQLVLVLAAGTVIFKVVATSTAAKAFHRPGPVIVTSALLLAQVGEFSFVLEQNGRAAGLTPAGVGEQGSQAFIATAVLLFILTPLLDVGGRRAGAWLERRAVARGESPAAAPIPAVGVMGGDLGGRALLAATVEPAGLDNPVTVRSADREHPEHPVPPRPHRTDGPRLPHPTGDQPMTAYPFLSDPWLDAVRELKAQHLGDATDQEGLTVNGTVTGVPFGPPVLAMHSTRGPVFGWEPGADPDAQVTITIDYDTARDLILDRTPNTLELALGAGEIGVDGDFDAFRGWWHARVGDADIKALEEAIRAITA